MLASSTRISRALRQRSLTCCSDMGWLCGVCVSVRVRAGCNRGWTEPVPELLNLAAGHRAGRESAWEQSLDRECMVYRSRLDDMPSSDYKQRQNDKVDLGAEHSADCRLDRLVRSHSPSSSLTAPAAMPRLTPNSAVGNVSRAIAPVVPGAVVALPRLALSLHAHTAPRFTALAQGPGGRTAEC